MKATPEFRKLCEEFLLPKLMQASSASIKEGEQHPPYLVINGLDHTEVPTIKSVPLDTQSDKDRVAYVQQKLSELSDISCVTFVSETWIVTMKTPQGAPIPEMPKGSLENHPLKTEAITYNFMSQGMQLICICPITRHEHPDRPDMPKATLEIGDWIDAGDGSATGRFVPEKRKLDS